jgi:hypothetical protein
MDSLSKNTQTSEVSKSADGRIKIEGSTAAIRWLFGLLDGSSPGDLGVPTDEITSTPPITPCMDAMSLADKFDIPCFRNLMTEAVLRLTEYGTYQALTAYSLAYNLGDQTLARLAVSKITDFCPPHKWRLDIVEAIGLRPWWSLIDAYNDLGDSAKDDEWMKQVAKKLDIKPVSPASAKS